MKIPSQNREYTVRKLIDMATNCPKEDLFQLQTIEDAIYWLQQDTYRGLRAKIKPVDDAIIEMSKEAFESIWGED